MTNQLPIFNVIGRTLVFQVANAFTLFRLTWLPLALLLVVEIGILNWFLGGLFGRVRPEFPALLILPLAKIVLQSLALSVVAVQVHRLVLFGERRANHYFIFPFGWTELRYVLMGMLSMSILIAPLSTAAYWYYTTRMKPADSVVAALLAAPEAVAAAPATSLLSVGFTVVVIVFFIWVALRLSVWPAAVVANNRLWPGDAWRATKGNVGNLFLMFICSLFVLVVIMSVIYGAFFTLAPQDSFVGPLARYGSPNTILHEFVTQFVMTTYTVAILSFAYRALKGFDAERSIGEQSEENDPILHMR